jgi:hypothetical protein
MSSIASLSAQVPAGTPSPAGTTIPAAGQAQVEAGSQTKAQGDALPMLPPEQDENPYSRLEIVSLGSFPILLFYSGFAFDLQRFFANGLDPAYAPWPFQNAYSAPLTDSDRGVRLGVALGASLVVGCVDAYLHAAKLRKARRLHEAAAAPGDTPGPAAKPAAAP